MKLLRSGLGIVLLAASAMSTFAQGAPPLSFAPLTQYRNQLGTGPSLAVFNGTMYSAFLANDSSYTLWITTSTNGSNWVYPGNHYTNIVMKESTGPSIAVFNGKLYVAYVASNSYVYLVSSSNGVTFSSPVPVYYPAGGQAQADGPPTLAVFDNYLQIAWERDGPGTTTYFEGVSTPDGVTFTGVLGCSGPNGEEPQTGAAVGLAVNNGIFYIAFQAQGDWDHHLVVCPSNQPYYDGNVYSFQVGSGISATSYDNSIYLTYKDLSGDNYLHISGSSNGTTFTDTVYSNIHTNGRQNIVPGTTVFNGVYFLQIVDNSSDHDMQNTYAY